MSNLSQHGNIIDSACIFICMRLLLFRNPKPFYEVINYYVTVENFQKILKNCNSGKGTKFISSESENEDKDCVLLIIVQFAGRMKALYTVTWYTSLKKLTSLNFYDSLLHKRESFHCIGLM